MAIQVDIRGQDYNVKILHPLTIRNRLLWYASQSEPTAVSPGLRGGMVGALNGVCQEAFTHTDDEGNETEHDRTALNRRLVLGWLLTLEAEPFVALSSNDLTPQQLYGLQLWMGAAQVDGVWCNRLGWNTEVAWVLTRARAADEMRRAERLEGRELLMRDAMGMRYETQKQHLDVLPDGMLRTAVRHLGGDPVGEAG